MGTDAFKLVMDDLEFLGDILSMGILKKGLEKVGSSPDLATNQDIIKALDAHIEAALVSFVGQREAKAKVIAIKNKLREREGS